MPAKNEAEVAIGGKVITLSGYESREYIQKVAAYLDNKLDEHKKMESYNRLPLEFQNIMIQLNIADEFFKAAISSLRVSDSADQIGRASCRERV